MDYQLWPSITDLEHPASACVGSSVGYALRAASGVSKEPALSPSKGVRPFGGGLGETPRKSSFRRGRTAGWEPRS